jgi:plastocyanin
MQFQNAHRIAAIILPVALISMIFIAGCTSGQQQTVPTTPSYNPSNTVLIGGASVNPQILTIEKGVPVTWLNMDSGVHIIVSDNGVPESFSSPALKVYERFIYAFTVPGTYTYHCADNAAIKGTIIVKSRDF